VLLTIILTMWNVKLAQAIVIIGGKTGMFTLTPHEG
jgi:hypothetical protein